MLQQMEVEDLLQENLSCWLLLLMLLMLVWHACNGMVALGLQSRDLPPPHTTPSLPHNTFQTTGGLSPDQRLVPSTAFRLLRQAPLQDGLHAHHLPAQPQHKQHPLPRALSTRGVTSLLKPNKALSYLAGCTPESANIFHRSCASRTSKGSCCCAPPRVALMLLRYAASSAAAADGCPACSSSTARSLLHGTAAGMLSALAWLLLPIPTKPAPRHSPFLWLLVPYHHHKPLSSSNTPAHSRQQKLAKGRGTHGSQATRPSAHFPWGAQMIKLQF